MTHPNPLLNRIATTRTSQNEVSVSALEYLLLAIQQHVLQEEGKHAPAFSLNEEGLDIHGTRLNEHTDPQLREKQREMVHFKLEAMGYDTGYRFIEWFSRDRPRMQDPLDAVKYVCKEFWTTVFKKQVDNLKTNHKVHAVFGLLGISYKGIFVLQDNSFWWLARLSTPTTGALNPVWVNHVSPLMSFPCGLLRGVMANLGWNVTVGTELNNMPQCTFKLEIVSPVLGR